MTGLRAAELHSSVADPVLGSIEFLNEIMTRYPDTISFAPGAPHRRFVDGVDPMPHVRRFLAHAAGTRGLDEAAARRLLFEYGPSRGLINDLVAAAWRRDHATDTDPASVVITVGAQEGMLLTLRVLFAAATDRLALPEPTFPGIVGAARLLDLDVVPVREGPGGLDPRALRTACRDARRDGARVRACYVAPDFANPSGTRMPRAAREDLLAVADEHDVVLLEDNAYGFTAGPDDPSAPLVALRPDRVVHIGTFAKIALF